MSAAPVPIVSFDRDTARQALRVYMTRTGLALNQVAELMGRAHHSLRQFISTGRYGDGEGRFTAKAVMDFIESHPPAAISAPGRLYETECTRAIRGMVTYVASGRWGILYGPAGSQKSFSLECIAAESAQLTPSSLLRRIATALAAPYAQSREGILQSVLFTVRRRRSPLALLIDEAQHLYRVVDTLETVRDLGDKSRGKIGILVSGNEDVLRLFEPRRGVYFEQWRSRIEQKTVRLTGLTGPECRQIVAAELGVLKPEAVEAILDKPVVDPETRRHYYSARRLFHAIRDFREMREKTLKTSVDSL